MQSPGHLYGGFFQLGYVARDLDQALAAYQEKFGKTEFLIFAPPDLPDGSKAPTCRIALAYIGELMIEIIEVRPENPAIYAHALPTDPKAIVLHHLGFLVPSHEVMLSYLEAGKYDVKWAGSAPGMLDYIYIDSRLETGHYLEFIHLHAGGEAFFASVPRNKQ
jgi:hypothetical protein